MDLITYDIWFKLQYIYISIFVQSPSHSLELYFGKEISNNILCKYIIFIFVKEFMSLYSEVAFISTHSLLSPPSQSNMLCQRYIFV